MSETASPTGPETPASLGAHTASKEAASTALSAREDEVRNRLLRLRSEMNRRRPEFVRMNSWMLKRLDDSWRSPRHSLDNKIRLERKGFPPRVKVGYRGPSKVRGLHPCGLIEVLVSTPSQLEGLNPRLHIVRIASTVGKKKRAEIIKMAQKKGFKVANP